MGAFGVLMRFPYFQLSQGAGALFNQIKTRESSRRLVNTLLATTLANVREWLDYKGKSMPFRELVLAMAKALAHSDLPNKPYDWGCVGRPAKRQRIF